MKSCSSECAALSHSVDKLPSAAVLNIYSPDRRPNNNSRRLILWQIYDKLYDWPTVIFLQIGAGFLSAFLRSPSVNQLYVWMLHLVCFGKYG